MLDWQPGPQVVEFRGIGMLDSLEIDSNHEFQLRVDGTLVGTSRHGVLRVAGGHDLTDIGRQMLDGDRHLEQNQILAALQRDTTWDPRGVHVTVELMTVGPNPQPDVHLPLLIRHGRILGHEESTGRIWQVVSWA